MKVLILGASGFVGKNLLEKIPETWQTLAVYHSSKEFPEWAKKYCPNVDVIKCNLSCNTDAKQLLEGLNFDVIISLVANRNLSNSAKNPIEDFEATTETIINTLQYARAKKFIFFSSGLVYENYVGAIRPDVCLNPLLPYAINKVAAEHYVRFGKKMGYINTYYIVRFWGAYGPWQHPSKVYSNLTQTFGVRKDPNFTIRGGGKSLIDAMYVGDTIKAIFNMIDSDHESITFDFAPHRPSTIEQAVKNAQVTFDINPIIKHEGESYEYIEFWTDDRENPFFNEFTLLNDGLLKLKDWQKQNPEWVNQKI